MRPAAQAAVLAWSACAKLARLGHELAGPGWQGRLSRPAVWQGRESNAIASRIGISLALASRADHSTGIKDPSS